MMKTCLITGGAGFIGSHVAEHLADEGWRVRVFDDLSTGCADNLSLLGQRVDFVQGSILDQHCLQQAMQGIEVVFHLAAKVSVPQSVIEPLMFHEICATGTLKVLESAKQAGVRRLVYAGSASAYGDAAPCPAAESSPLAPLSPYAAAKLSGEHYCSAYSATSRLETVRLRYFNVYGPRQVASSPYSGVISIFCDRLSRGEPARIYGDGLQCRDFVFVSDVAEANRLAAVMPGINGRVFNIGCGIPVTIVELFQAVRRRFGASAQPEFDLPRIGDVRMSQADISAAAEVLGFRPAVMLDEGLARTVQRG